MTDKERAEFLQAYKMTALWSSNGDDGKPLDDTYGPGDIAPETAARMTSDCERFIAAAGDMLVEENCLKYGPDFGWAGRAGHDFWLTRNGHGCGFWDGDWTEEVGDKLSDIAQQFGEVDLYVADIGEHAGMICD